MLPRKLRLSRSNFTSQTPEKRGSSPHFNVIYRPSELNGGCAVVVSKKVARLSTGRHRIKRRIMAILMPYCTPTAALIVHAKAGIGDLPFVLLKEELTALLMRLGTPRIR